MQLTLLKATLPESAPGIVIHLGDVSLVLAERGARLVIADPPWEYYQPQVARDTERDYVELPYYTLSHPEIIRTLDASWDACGEDAYLLCWVTWPHFFAFVGALHAQPMRWRYVSGGAWSKTTGRGIGYHQRGDSEPYLLFVKGSPGKPREALGNAPASPRGRNSEKPMPFLEDVMRAFTQPGDLVLSVYSGLCPEARAAKRCGRRLVGAEIDPKRHADALAYLAQTREGTHGR